MLFKQSFKETFPKDLLASVVTFLVALPLCMGIAIASGAPPAAGLITGIIGGMVVGFISGCALQVSGPAAGLAVIVYGIIQEQGILMLGPILILAGLLQMAAGALRFGQLFRAITPAVVYGMLAGIGVLIFGAQFHVMVDDAPRASGLKNLLAIPQAIWKGIFPPDGTVHHLAALTGIVTIAVLLAWNKFAPSKVKWIPGALVGVVVATLTAQLAGMPINYVNLPASLFNALHFPGLTEFSRLADWHVLLSAAVLAFIASVETLLSAAAVDQMHDGPRTNYDRELFSQGVGNTICGFIGGLPMTGVIVRSATNVAAGAKTRASAILHGSWLFLLVALAPQVLRLIPTASLAAVLVYTGYKLVSPYNIKRLRSYGTVPVGIYAVTLVMIVATDLLTGIVCGLILSFLNVMYGRTHMAVRITHHEGPKSASIYLSGAATFVRLPKLQDALEKLPRDAEVDFHIQQLEYIDDACLSAIEGWLNKRNERNAPTTLDWDGLMRRYRFRDEIGQAKKAPVAVTTQ